jgi:hypothetical protein
MHQSVHLMFAERARIVAVAIAALIAGAACQQRPAVVDAADRGTAADGMPVFEVDPAWPPPLPYNWKVGHVPSVAVDSRDHIFVLSRPNTLPPEERARAAPPVVELDESGRFVNAWGGPGIGGFDWPDSEHGIAIDGHDDVWIGGSAPVAPSLLRRNDDMLLKFTHDGGFLLQIGGRDKSPTSASPPIAGGNRDPHSLHQPADAFVYAPANELFVADGYGNRRVAVFDAGTGVFKRAWGAFGKEPLDVLVPSGPPTADRSLDTEGEGAPQFGSPVHSVKVSHDGRVYVADRANRRVQVFSTDGTYVTQMFLNRGGPAGGSAAGLAFSPDPGQRFLYIADYGNSRIAVVERTSLKLLYQFGQRSDKPGDFQGLHHLAADSKGNLYTGEVAPGVRMQRFLYKGLSTAVPPNGVPSATPGS